MKKDTTKLSAGESAAIKRASIQLAALAIKKREIMKRITALIGYEDPEGEMTSIITGEIYDGTCEDDAVELASEISAHAIKQRIEWEKQRLDKFVR